MYNTHTAHSGDGHRAGDETETLVHTDVQICGPGKRETSFWGPFFLASLKSLRGLFDQMTGLTCPRPEALVPGTEDKYLPQLKASPL